MHKLQIPKRTRNNYKNGKQTNLQVPGTRKAVQKSQTTAEISKLSANNKVCIIHQSEINHLYLAKYVSQTEKPDYSSKKKIPYMAKTQTKGKLDNH